MEEIYLKQLTVFEEFLKQLAKKSTTSTPHNEYGSTQAKQLYLKLEGWNNEREEKLQIPRPNTLKEYFYTYRKDLKKYQKLSYSEKFVDALTLYLDDMNVEDDKKNYRLRYRDFYSFCDTIKDTLGYADVKTNDLIYYKNNTKQAKTIHKGTNASRSSSIGDEFENAGNRTEKKNQSDAKKSLDFGDHSVSVENKNGNITIQLHSVVGEDTVLKYIDPDFKNKLNQLFDSIESIEKVQEAIKNVQSVVSSTVDEKYAIKEPPDFWEVSPYTLTDIFIGRERELQKLNDWAASDIPVMIVEGIGGLGKSAIVYEWINQYTNDKIYGKLWWSFYDHTSLEEFVKYALAYLTKQTPSSIIGSYQQNAEQLILELQERPSVLILDGLERILVAYHRWDKAQQRDDEIDNTLRLCTNPTDERILRSLIRASPSKIVITSRLIPSIFQDVTTGIAFYPLEGFSELDTINYFQENKIYGSTHEILSFCEKFGFHSLVIKIICSSIGSYFPKPGNFDAWLKDPNYGGSLKLSELDIRDKHFNKSKILEFALGSLEKKTSLLLSRIAILPENIEYEIVEKMNPFQFDFLKKPLHIKDSIRWNYLWEEKFKRDVLPQFEAKYKDELSEYETYSELKKQAIPNLHKAIKELVERGLVTWDTSEGKNCFNMHPVVRGHAKDINLSDNKDTYTKAKDYFSAIPEGKKTKDITDLSQIDTQLRHIHSLIGAELYEDTLTFYKNNLHAILATQLYNFSRQVEYLKALFKDQKLLISSSTDQEWIYSKLAYGLHYIGNDLEALPMIKQAIQINLDNKKWGDLSTCLSILINIYDSLNTIYACHKIAELRYQLCTAVDLPDVKNALLFLVSSEIKLGNFKKANTFFHEHEDYVTKNPGALFWKWANEFYQGRPMKQLWEAAYQKAIDHHHLLIQRYCLTELAIWKMELGEAELAYENINKAINLIQIMGEYNPTSYSIKAWILAHLNRKEEAKNQLLLIDENDHLYYAAIAWWLLGEEVNAKKSVIRAYKNSWSLGPPYTYKFTMDKTKKFMDDRGWEVPELSHFDENKEVVPFQKEIETIIDRLNAKKKKA